jgi:membrane protease YdiL (CAAX protease family)
MPIDPALFWLSVSRIAIFLFTGFIAWVTYRTNQLLQEIELDFNVLLSLPETISRLLFVGLCLFLAWLSGLPADQLGLTTTFSLGWSIALGASIGLLAQVLVNVITVAAIKRFGRHIYSSWLVLNILPRRPIEWLLVALAFIPPVAMEELLFRTLWLGVFESLLPLPLLIIGTSVVFGWMHQPQGKLGILLAGAINVLFSLLFIWTGQVLVTFVAHYTMNMAQIVTAYVKRDDLQCFEPQSIDKKPVQ